MKKIVCFHLDDCPYCHKARRAFDELCAENPAWKNIPVEWVEETRETPSELKNFNYYYVPTIYVGAEKVYEANPADDYAKIKSNVRKALAAAAG